MGHPWLAALVLAAAGTPALGEPEVDPLKSDACKAALVELEKVANRGASPARSARLAQARESAATICLGRSQGRGVRSGAPYPAQPVAPPAISTPRPQVSLPAVLAPPAAVSIPRPTVITTCDPAGCWDSDGRRLDRMGPLLMSPRGPCTVQGGFATCP